MINMLIILLILSFSGVFLLVIYMNYLNKLINKLEKKIDSEPNLERLWHDSNEEPKKYPILCEDKKNRVWIDHNLKDYIESWDMYVEFCEIIRWAYISDLLPKGGKK